MDLFVLLDTIKIVLMGGASLRRGDKLTEFEKKLQEAKRQVYSNQSPSRGEEMPQKPVSSSC
jgi:hypothetical protein